jgi:hypothetical protein
MLDVVSSIESEYRRYKKLGEGALQQVPDDELGRTGPGGGSSLAVVVWHISGNLKSRFTDFLTSDGEKPWRDRESEFDDRAVTRAELLARWEEGWTVLFGALAGLGDEHLPRSVTIRGEAHTVAQALHRSLAHTAYHVGQIVYLCKSAQGGAWKSLTIPRRPR